MTKAAEVGKLMSYMLRGSGGDAAVLRDATIGLSRRGDALNRSEKAILKQATEVGSRLQQSTGYSIYNGGISGNLSSYFRTGGGMDMLSRSLKVGAGYGAVGAVQEGANDGSMWQGFKSHFFRGAVAGAGYSAFKGAAFSEFAAGRTLNHTLGGYKGMYRGYGAQGAVSNQLSTLLQQKQFSGLATHLNGLGGTRYSGV